MQTKRSEGEVQGGLRKRRIALSVAIALGAGLGGSLAQAQEAITSEPWKVDIYYENDTHVRGKDNTGHRVGLSKFRNTLQVEADKKLNAGWSFHGILRGTWDGVYRLNKDEYGEDAGGPITLESTISRGGGIVAQVPHGGAAGPVVTRDVAAGPPLGLTTNAFLNPAQMLAINPNDGLRVLGDRWHDTKGGVAFGVPVRPCDRDKRGCRDFGGYGDQSLTGLEFPEFNDNLDFIREAYVKNTFDLGDNKSLFLKVGKQQVVWGRTDLFRVLDVINPVDYSRNNIYDELEDIRIPQWIVQAEYRMGGSDLLQERNLQLVWNFDQFRANNLGQCGSPNVILDAGCFFRGMVNLWDNGGTVANFAHLPAGAAAAIGLPPDHWLATNFGPHQIGIRDVKLPSWGRGMQLGVKYEGVTQGGLAFSLNALTYRSQLPSLRAFNTGGVNPFIGVGGNPPGFPGVSHLIAFDVHYPRVNLVGGSMDFQIDALKAAVRLEGALTDGEEFPNTSRPKLYSKNKVFRSVIGIDRPTFIPWINPNRTTLFSGQLFYQHIFDHDYEQSIYGPVGIPDWKDNVIGTLLIKAFLMNDRVSPQLILARDFRAHAWVASPQLEWSFTDNLKLTVGANVKGREGDSRWKFDDCRSCNPFPPFTTYSDDGQPFAPGSIGLGGLEPMGRFRAGPIGAAWKENQAYVTVKYKF